MDHGKNRKQANPDDLQNFIKTRMKEVDKDYLSPMERATLLWETFQTAYRQRFGKVGPEPFDMMMLSIEYLGQIALGLEDDGFLEKVKSVNNHVYSMHYNHPETLHGKPDREKWEAWFKKERERRNGHGLL